GVTKHGESDIYSQLVAMQPVPEEKGAMISYDLKTKRYGIPILDSVKAMGITQQCQFDALLSVAYNSGNGSITQSNSLTNAIAKN
ncbi:glycoside hydrolase family protein, partial [Mycobacterium kansasii]